MKVKDLLEDLKKANPDAELKISTPYGEAHVLSVYSFGKTNIDKEDKMLYIDIGTEEDDEFFQEMFLDF